MPSRTLSSAILAGVLWMWMTAGAAAQGTALPGCEPSQAGDPPRTVYTCPNGLVLEAEAASGLGVVRGAGDNAAALRSGAVYVTVPTGTRFQIRTPSAIASVRGTQYAVAIEASRTSVFVVEGVVHVSSTAGGTPVTLAAGEGVDVAPGATALTVTQWPAARAATLLSRFGR